MYVCPIENGFRYSFVPFRHFWFQKHKIYLYISWLFVIFYCCSTTGFLMFLFPLCFSECNVLNCFDIHNLKRTTSKDHPISLQVLQLFLYNFNVFCVFLRLYFYRIITVITTLTFCWVSVFSTVLHKCRLFSGFVDSNSA